MDVRSFGHGDGDGVLSQLFSVLFILMKSNFFLIFIYLFLAVLGLRFCARAFSSCSKRGPLFITVRGPLTIAASLVAEHRLQTRRLSSCGSQAQLLRSMWDLPRPGLEPVSPALASRLSTTAPPGKPLKSNFNIAPELIEKKRYFSIFTWVLYQDYINFFEAVAEAQGGGVGR